MGQFVIVLLYHKNSASTGHPLYHLTLYVERIYRPLAHSFFSLFFSFLFSLSLLEDHLNQYINSEIRIFLLDARCAGGRCKKSK